MEKIDGHDQENQSSERQFHVWDSSGHLHLHPAASPCCLPSFRFNTYRPCSLRWVTQRRLAQASHALWPATPGFKRLRLPSGWFIASQDFSPHRPSSVARLNYIIYKTVEDLWTPLTLRAVWLVGTPSVPVETYTHQRLSMQKIQETQRGGQRWFCAMKMVHKGPLRREINVSWLKGACCDGPEDVSQMWGGWMNVSGIPQVLRLDSKLCQKCMRKYATFRRVCALHRHMCTLYGSTFSH